MSVKAEYDTIYLLRNARGHLYETIVKRGATLRAPANVEIIYNAPCARDYGGILHTNG